MQGDGLNTNRISASPGIADNKANLVDASLKILIVLSVGRL
jgi:hypothetical protein